MSKFKPPNFGDFGRRPRGPRNNRAHKTRYRKHPIVRKKTARFRSRISPNPFLGSNITTGQYHIETSPGNYDFVPITAPRNDSPSYPYLSAESCSDELHGTPPWITGGPFRKIKIEPVVPFTMLGSKSYYTNDYMNLAGMYGRIKYVGGFSPPDPFPGAADDTFTLSQLSSKLGKDSSLVASTSTLEAQVWDRTKPRLEQGGLAVAIAESRDIGPMLRTSGRGLKQITSIIRQLQAFHYVYKRMGGDLKHGLLQPKGVAGHFLNHSFGWVPFVSDTTKFLDNVINSDTKIRRIIDENGKDIRRRAKLLNHTESIKLADEEGCLVSPGNTYILQACMVAPPRYEVWLDRDIEAHSVGRFRYYVPYFDPSNPQAQGVLGEARRQLAIHGARLTPLNIYRSIKWTWLIDWVSNTGRTISAIQDQALDNMAATYLYLCHTERKTYRFRQTLPFNFMSGGPITLEWSRVIEVKQRKEAEAPFGFGLSWEELTPRQLSLLAAIGITRR
jgi:hypothetical protein